MKLLLCGLLLVCSLARAATTTITDTIYNTDGTTWNGTIYVRLNRACTQSGTPLTPSTITITVTSGAVSQALEANDTCVPSNTFYIVRYVSSAVAIPASPVRNAFWRVPTSGTAVTISSIESSTESALSTAVPASAITGLTNTYVLFGGSGGSINNEAALTWLTSTKQLKVGTNQFTLSSGSNITQLTVRAGSSQSTNALTRWSNSSDTSLSIIDSDGALTTYSSGTAKIYHGGGTSRYASDATLSWKDNTAVGSGSVDLSLSRSSGKLLVSNGAGTNKSIIAATATGADEVVTRGSGSVATDDCAKWDSSGRIVSAGAACGSGGGGATDVTATSTFGTDNRALRSDGPDRGSQSSLVSIDDSGNMSTPGTISSGSGVMGLLGTCRAPGSVSTPAASNFEFFCDSSNGNRWSSKDSSGTTVAYLKTGDASSGGGVGEWSSSINFGTVLDLSCSDATFTATGLTTGTVLLVVPYSGVGAISAQAWPSAADTAKVRVCNSSGGDLSVSGTFTVKAARGYLSGSGTVDFASIPAGSTATATVTVTGATTSMGAVPLPPAAFNSGILLTARVTAADTVTLYAANLTDADIDPASGSFTGMVIQ